MRFAMLSWEHTSRSKKSARVNEVTSVKFTTQTGLYGDRKKKSETALKHFDYGRLKTLGNVVPGKFSLSYDKL